MASALRRTIVRGVPAWSLPHVKSLQLAATLALGGLLRRLPGNSQVFGPPRRVVETLADYARCRGIGYRELRQPQWLDRVLPPALDGPLHFEFRTEERRLAPAAGIAVLPHGRVLTGSGSVITEDDCLIAEVSNLLFIPNPDANPIFLKTRLPPLRRVAGTIALLTAPSSQNYYHWLFDALPRLSLINGAGIPFDRLIAPQQTPFQRATLEILGIDPSRIIADPEAQLEAERLIVPTLPGLPGNPPRWVCDYLRDHLLRPVPEHLRRARKIYISREKSGTRLLVNEDEVWHALERRGFERVRPEELPFTEQARLFDQAQMIVAAHGSGLTNLVFCRPGTKVVELFSPHYVNVCYWALANQMKLHYCYLRGHPTRRASTGRAWVVHENILVNLPQLERVLDGDSGVDAA